MALPTIQNAPADITPEKFFGQWLPTQAEQFKAIMPLLGDITATMGIKVTGDEGGEWSCTISKDGLKIEQGLRDDAVVTVRLDKKNFVAAVTGQLKMGPGAGAKAPSPEQAPQMLKDAITAVKQINGILRYQLEDPDQGDFLVDVKFAGPLNDDADVQVTMARETAESMAAGDLNPQAAFMAGQVQISGDMSILMQLMPLMSM